MPGESYNFDLKGTLVREKLLLPQKIFYCQIKNVTSALKLQL